MLNTDQNDNNKDIDITLILLSKWDMRNIEEVEEIENLYYLYCLYYSDFNKVWDFYIDIVKSLKNLTCWTYINNLTIISTSQVIKYFTQDSHIIFSTHILKYI